MPQTYPKHRVYRQWERGQFGDRGLLSEVWRQVFEADPGLHTVALCIDLVFGFDNHVLIADKECHTTSGSTGDVRHFRGHLGEGWEIVWEYKPGDPNSMAKTLNLRLPNALVDCAALLRQARILGGVAEVSLQVRGGDYDQRLVLMRGDLTDVSFGATRQVVSCTVSDPKESSDQRLPPYTITTERFANAIDASIGKVLAVVAPEFGALPAHFISGSTSAPDVVVCHGTLNVQTVYVDGVAYGSGSGVYPWSELHGVDRLGEPYTGVSFTGGTGTFDGEGGEKVYVVVDGGQPESAHPVELVRWAVERHTSLGVRGGSRDLFARARARSGLLLARLAANASGSGNTTTLTFLEGTFLKSFPMISMAWAWGGYGPVVTDRRDDRVRHRLVADQWPVLDRATSVKEVTKGETYNSFSISYDYDPLTDEYRGYMERTPENSTLCKLSEQVMGPRPKDTEESLFITDDGTAGLCLDWQVAHLTLPGHDVEYDVAPVLVLQTMLGDNVRLTDSEFSWDETLGTVRRLVLRPARGSMGLRVWNDAMGLGGGAATAVGASFRS